MGISKKRNNIITFILILISQSDISFSSDIYFTHQKPRQNTASQELFRYHTKENNIEDRMLLDCLIYDISIIKHDLNLLRSGYKDHINTENYIHNNTSSRSFWTKFFQFGGNWISAIVLIFTLYLVGRQVKIGVKQVKATRRMRQQEVFIKLMSQLNELEHLSLADFQSKKNFEQKKIRNQYHNYLDLIDQLFNLECENTEDVKKLVDEIISEHNLYKAKDNNGKIKNRTKIIIPANDEYAMRLMLLYKIIQRYYINTITIEDFKNPFHDSDPHLCEDRIVNHLMVEPLGSILFR